MDVNIVDNKDGEIKESTQQTPSIMGVPKLENNAKKKRRRGKSKRKIMKPFVKTPWQDRRKNDKTKRNNRFRKLVLNKTHAPFNNNQFLMEIHKPEPENNFSKTPARTRESSFSIDSEDNYFFSLPEDEEEYLTKEFSSVYEDAQCERLSNMSKNELIQEYLLLEAKYDNLMKRSERTKPRNMEDEKDTVIDKDTSAAEDRDSMVTETDKDISANSYDSSIADDNMDAIMRHVKEQESQIRELQLANDQLRMENETLRQRTRISSSEDSESDSSTTSGSSSSSCCMSPAPETVAEEEEPLSNGTHNGQNDTEANNVLPLANGFSEE